MELIQVRVLVASISAIVNKYGHSLMPTLNCHRIRQSIDGRHSIPHKHPPMTILTLSVVASVKSVMILGPDINLLVESAVLGGTCY